MACKYKSGNSAAKGSGVPSLQTGVHERVAGLGLFSEIDAQAITEQRQRVFAANSGSGMAEFGTESDAILSPASDARMGVTGAVKR